MITMTCLILWMSGSMPEADLPADDCCATTLTLTATSTPTDRTDAGASLERQRTGIYLPVSSHWSPRSGAEILA